MHPGYLFKEAPVSTFATAGTAVARVFLFPGNIACSAVGVDSEDKRELVRMLVNSLVWILVGMFVAVAVT